MQQVFRPTIHSSASMSVIRDNTGDFDVHILPRSLDIVGALH
jgi:hypothetical protein